MSESNQTNTVETEATAVEPTPEKSRMEVELMRLSIEVLNKFLDGEGFVSKPDTPKAELVQAIIKLQEKKLKDSQETVAKATEEIKSDDDPLVTFTFMNLECPNAPLEFTYPGPKGFKKGPGGKVLIAPKWSFQHNNSYTVPYSVVKHIQSLQVPADQQVQTSAEGFIMNLYSGASQKQPRFACNLSLTPEQERRIVQKE